MTAADFPAIEDGRDLVGLAAAIYSQPDSLPLGLAPRLTALMTKPGPPQRTIDLAGELLEFLLATSHGPYVVTSVARLLSEPDLSVEASEVLCRVLQYAASWAPALLDPSAVVKLAESEHLRPYRDRFCEHVLRPALFAAGVPVETALLERVARLYGENPGFPYLLHCLSGWKQFPTESREWAAEALRGRFRWREEAARRLGGEGRRILVVHNINDGQGDEIVRYVPLVQALLDFNQKLEAVVVTRRVYLCAHPRVTMVPISDRSAVGDVLQESFDGVIDFFEPNVTQLNHDVELEHRIQEYVETRKPFLFASSLKGFHRFVFERLELDGAPIAETSGLNVQRVASTYETTSRLIAELGLPLRCGEDAPSTEFVLAGMDWPEARIAWRALIEGNSAGWPVALVNLFGGIGKLKGFVEQTFDAAAAEVEQLIGEGYFVVMIPNGTAWGRAAMAFEIARLVDPEQRIHLAVAADPADSEEIHENIPGAPPLQHRDWATRQLLYFARYADLIVTVEGWLMHTAWCLGKPYRVLMAPYSHSEEWHPYFRTGRQGVQIEPARESGRPDPAGPPPVVEQPRKFILLFLLREFGNACDSNALPLLSKTLGSPDRHLRRAAAEALGKFSDPAAARELLPLLQDSASEVRAAAAGGLLKAANVGAVPQTALLAYTYIGRPARDWNQVLRLGDAARPAVETALQDEDAVVRREAAQAIQLLDFGSAMKVPRDYRMARPGIVGLIRSLIAPPGRSKENPATKTGTVLILTPVKDAASCLDRYSEQLRQLTYPHRAISLGFLESDSSDETFEVLSRRARALGREFRRIGLWKRDFGYQVPRGIHRGAEEIQVERRLVLAKSRNHLLAHALDDEEWVLWLDADVIEYPADIIERLLATGKDVVQPHCVLDYGGPTFDRNGWRDRGRLHLDDLRAEGDLVELHAVGGTMLLVRADLHRDGLVFPAFRYGQHNPLIRDRGELETEGLGLMARDMGYRCWGMPHLEIRHGRW